MAAVPRATGRTVPLHPQHWPNGRTLAHAHKDRPGPDTRADVTECVAGDEYPRCAVVAIEASRSRGCYFTARAGPERRIASDRNRRTGPGFYAFPFRRDQCESGYAECI